MLGALYVRYHLTSAKKIQQDSVILIILHMRKLSLRFKYLSKIMQNVEKKSTHVFLCDVTSYFNEFFFISFSIEFAYSLQINLNALQGT